MNNYNYDDREETNKPKTFNDLRVLILDAEEDIIEIISEHLVYSSLKVDGFNKLSDIDNLDLSIYSHAIIDYFRGESRSIAVKLKKSGVSVIWLDGSSIDNSKDHEAFDSFHLKPFCLESIANFIIKTAPK